MRYKVSPPLIVLAIMAGFVSVGCKRKSVDHCLQMQIPKLLQEAKQVKQIKMRPAFLRRQLLQRCKMPLPLQKAIHYLAFDGRNRVNDKIYDAMSSKYTRTTKLSVFLSIYFSFFLSLKYTRKNRTLAIVTSSQ